VGGMGFLKLISQAFPRPIPQPPLVFFPLFRSLYFSLALHYLNAWNRLARIGLETQLLTGMSNIRGFKIIQTTPTQRDAGAS